MNISDLKPASFFAKKQGVKMIMYGPAGSSKTPLIQTAPRPILCACEPGLASMSTAHNVATWIGDTEEKLMEFLNWVYTSRDIDYFDTIVFDSLTEMCEIVLAKAKTGNKHGLKAYGIMEEKILPIVNRLFRIVGKHVVLICKEEVLNDNGIAIRRPFYPGRALPVKMPHLFDVIARVAVLNVPDLQPNTLAIQSHNTFDVSARNRFGNTLLYEPANLTAFFNKCMS